MGGKQILKLVFLVLIVLLAVTIFVCGAMLSKIQGADFRDKSFRVLHRVRIGCFLAMLFLLLGIVVIT